MLEREPFFTVTALGQMLMTKDFRILRPETFRLFQEILADSAFVVSNLEPALGIPGIGTPTRPPNSPTHVMPVKMLQTFQDLGINMVAAASNHTWDLGTDSLIASIAQMKKYGFAFSGIGKNRTESVLAGRICSRGHRGAILSMATGKIRPGAAAGLDHAGVNELRLSEDGTPFPKDAEEELREITRCKADGSYTAIVMHNHMWGADKSLTPDWMVKWAHACIDAGGDLFLGHGAPLLHGIEIYKERPIIYNLGSFVFNCSDKTKWGEEVYWQSALIRLQCRPDGALEEMNILPIQLDRETDPHGFPSLADVEQGQRIRDHLEELSLCQFGTKLKTEKT